MKCKVTVIGAGRMGSIVANQLPDDVEKLIIDTDFAKAKAVAEGCGAAASDQMSAASDADVILVVLPTPAVAPAGAAAAEIAKDGALIVNMATKGNFSPETVAAHPALSMFDAKIIGHANSMRLGAPCYVVVNTESEAEFETVAHVLSGYKKVVRGDSSLVPLINSIGSGEGVRAAVKCRKLLKQYNIPKEWEDIVIYTVCAGTMRSYVDNDLGEFARVLADKMEAEEGLND